METQSSIRILFAQNPAVAAAAVGKQPGDEFPMELVRPVVKSVNGSEIEIVYDAVVPEGYEEKEESSEAVATPMTGMADATIPTGVASLVGKKA